MMFRRGLAALLVLATVPLAACTPQELGEFFADQDIRTSEDPSEAAAGHAAEAISTDRAAQQLVTEGLRQKDPDKLLEAVDQRPSDARYPAYVAVLGLAEDGDVGRFMDRTFGSARLYIQERQRSSEASVAQLYDQWLLIVMGTLDHALLIEHERDPNDPARIERLERAFCGILSFRLREHGTAERDVLNLMFLGGPTCEEAWEGSES